MQIGVQNQKASNGSIKCYKACMVAKSFNQQEGIDYDETFNSAIMPIIIHTIISLVVFGAWLI